MARLTISLLSSVFIFATPLALPAQPSQRPELTVSGSCARCHVSATLEWGLSKHSTITKKRNSLLPNCIGCHGESRAHVIDEQNNVKPDRIPRGAAIAALCLECHVNGCGRSMDRNNCQTCHHIHALVNPNLDAATIEKRVKDFAARLDSYQGHLDAGERFVQQAQWKPAQAEFAAALKDYPASIRAKTALTMIARRLQPGFSGFKVVGDQFDAPSGLPKEIVMEGLGLGLVLIPAGSFDLGSEQHPNAKPVHTVDVAPFYMAKYELTQAQWKALMAANPSYYQGENFPQADQLPVERVSWDDCRAMLVEINKRIPGGGFRLPTEAEWEYAARAGSADPADAANVLSPAGLREDSPFAEAASDVKAASETKAAVPGAGPGRGARGPRGTKGAPTVKMAQAFRAMQGLEMPDNYAPHPVGASQPNSWGLYDMLGNVSEWCSSLSLPYPYDAADGRESTVAPGARVLRGANFVDTAESTDPALRHSDRPDRKFRWNGVRLVFSPPEPAGSATP
jgi:formylglycine-generating enzyme required for sulfatase activity